MIRKGDLFYVYRYKDSLRKTGRPAVVVSGDERNRESDAVIVVFLSARPGNTISVDYVPILFCGKLAYAITGKPSTITKDRLSRCVGRVAPAEITSLESALCRVLEL